ncbi:hypothetical protein [Streptomyces longwoodensis]|uniref:hypothetical protein n=1 Tax=Streptomyces longwoodensis TaxID=68231 RepID=UPI0036E4F053
MSGRVVPAPATGRGDPAVQRLVQAAFETIRSRYVLARHQIAAAILDADGTVHVGLHVDAMIGRAAVCAEACALSAARLSTDAALVAVAAVRYPKPTEPPEARLVPACGLCRELLLDHAPDLTVAINGSKGIELMPLKGLLPHKYVGTKWAACAAPEATPTQTRL